MSQLWVQVQLNLPVGFPFPGTGGSAQSQVLVSFKKAETPGNGCMTQAGNQRANWGGRKPTNTRRPCAFYAKLHLLCHHCGARD